MSIKRVCMVTTVHRMDDTRIFFKEILSMANSGYKIDFIVKKSAIKYSHPNVNFIFLPPTSSFTGRVKNIFLSFKNALKSRASIYHIHDPELILLGLCIKFFSRRRVVYDIHEIHSDEIKYKPYLPEPIAYLIAEVYFLFEKISAKVFDINILAEEQYQHHFPWKNFIVIQNFMPLRYMLDKPRRKWDEALRLEFVYLGTITKIRGIFEILNFAMFLKRYVKLSFTIHLIGPFPSQALENRVKAEIERNELKANFMFYGVVPFPESQELLRQCDIGLIFLHPILNNLTILPTKLFEYMGNGLAVMMSNFPLWEEFNKKNECGLTVDIFNFEKEKEKICLFLRNCSSLNEIKFRNIQTVKENYTWEVEEKKLLTAYESIL